MVIRQTPVDMPRCSSACRSLSRRPWAARSGNRSADPSAIRCRSPTSSDSARSSAGVTGSAVTSQPNGPVQLPSSPSSSDSPARPGAPAAPGAPVSPGSASRPSLIPAISRQQAELPKQPGQLARRQRPAARPARQREQHLAVGGVDAADERVPGRDHQHRPARRRPDPAERDRPGRLRDTRVVRGHQRGRALRAAGIAAVGPRGARLRRLGAARYLGDPVGRASSRHRGGNCHITYTHRHSRRFTQPGLFGRASKGYDDFGA